MARLVVGGDVGGDRGVGNEGAAVDLVAELVAGGALGGQVADAGLEPGGAGGALGRARSARGVGLHAQVGDGGADGVGHRDELALEAEAELAAGVDQVRAGGGGLGDPRAGLGEVALVALAAEAQLGRARVGALRVDLHVGHVDGVVEEARALLPAVAGAEEDDHDAAGEGAGGGEAGGHFGEEGAVGGGAALRGEVGRQAVGVERRGEDEDLRGGVRRGGQQGPEVAAGDVVERGAGVEHELAGAVGLQEPGGLGGLAGDVDARDEGDGGEGNLGKAPLVHAGAADEDDGAGAVDEGLLDVGLGELGVEDGDGAAQVLAVDFAEGAVADVDGGAADRLGQDEGGGAVVDEVHALGADGGAAVGEREPLGDLGEGVERLVPGREAGGGELVGDGREGAVQLRGADAAVRQGGERLVDALVDRGRGGGAAGRAGGGGGVLRGGRGGEQGGGEKEGEGVLIHRLRCRGSSGRFRRSCFRRCGRCGRR